MQMIEKWYTLIIVTAVTAGLILGPLLELPILALVSQVLLVRTPSRTT